MWYGVEEFFIKIILRDLIDFVCTWNWGIRFSNYCSNTTNYHIFVVFGLKNVLYLSLLLGDNAGGGVVLGDSLTEHT